MPPISPTVAHFRAKKARADQLGDDAAAEAAAHGLEVAKLEDHIRRVVDEAPPLTAEQRDRLAVLFRSGGDVA